MMMMMIIDAKMFGFVSCSPIRPGTCCRVGNGSPGQRFGSGRVTDHGISQRSFFYPGSQLLLCLHRFAENSVFSQFSTNIRVIPGLGSNKLVHFIRDVHFLVVILLTSYAERHACSYVT